MTLSSGRSALVFLFVGALMMLPRPAAAAPCTDHPFTTAKSGGLATISIDWELLKKCVDAKTDPGGRIEVRLDEDTNVSTRAFHFNFVNYTLSYKVEETVVETYVNLAKLWTQILGLPGGIAQADLARADACQTFATCLGGWAWQIVQAEITLDGYLRRFGTQVVLSDGDVAKVQADAGDMAMKRDLLVAAALDISNTHPPTTLEEVDKFRRVYASHVEMLGRIAAFGAAADLVRDGETHNIGKKKGGTIVTITITPKTQTQAVASPVAGVEYFTHSRIPVIFHVGYAYSKIADVEVETVRSASQADLFSVVKNNDDTNAMVAFLSLGQTVKGGQLGFFATLGTDFSKPGERVYAGGSIQLGKRAFITGGWVSGTDQVPANRVTETIGNALQARELFAVLNPERKWHGFGAISFRVF